MPSVGLVKPSTAMPPLTLHSPAQYARLLDKYDTFLFDLDVSRLSVRMVGGSGLGLGARPNWG